MNIIISGCHSSKLMMIPSPFRWYVRRGYCGGGGLRIRQRNAYFLILSTGMVGFNFTTLVFIRYAPSDGSMSGKTNPFSEAQWKCNDSVSV